MCVGPWICWFCNEIFTDPDAAKIHFGIDEMDKPGCVAKLTPEEHARRMQEIQASVREYEARIEAARAEEDADLANSERAEMKRLFRGARSVHQAYQELDFERGKVLAATEFIQVIEAIAPAAVAEARERLKLYPDAYAASPKAA